MSNQKVFITGVAGFLGSHLADHFLKLGYEVHGVDNLIGGYLDNVPNDVIFTQGNMLDLAFLEAITPKDAIIYHTACTAYEGLSVFSPSLVCSNTFQITVNMLSVAIKTNASLFVQCSSMARYGATSENGLFSEDMECKPQDPYGIAKYAAERLIENLCGVHGLDYVIAVPHNIIGPRQKYDDPFRNVASIMANLMLQGRQPVIYGDGTQIRCFSDIRDDIGCLAEFALNDRAVGQIFNIGPDEEPVTILQLAQELASIIGFNLDPIFLEGRPQEVKFATCSANKIRQYFDYETKFNLRESLIDLVNYIENRGVKEFEYHLPVEIDSPLTPKTWSERLF